MTDLKMADAAATSPGAATPVLTVKDLEAWYGESHILHGINFNVKAGEVVALLGRNGAGKTTTLKSVMGIIGKRTGSIAWRQDITDLVYKIAAWASNLAEERGIFARLDVRENCYAAVVRQGGLRWIRS